MKPEASLVAYALSIRGCASVANSLCRSIAGSDCDEKGIPARLAARFVLESWRYQNVRVATTNAATCQQMSRPPKGPQEATFADLFNLPMMMVKSSRLSRPPKPIRHHIDVRARDFWGRPCLHPGRPTFCTSGVSGLQCSPKCCRVARFWVQRTDRLGRQMQNMVFCKICYKCGTGAP